MKVIAYISCLDRQYTKDEFEILVSKFSESNRQHGITGVLYCNIRSIIQVIEGEPDMINSLWNNIKRDKRHHNIRKMLETDISTRIFPEWSMQYVCDENCTTTTDVYHKINTMKRICMLLDTFKVSLL